ncbi:TspO and MBR related proteins [Sphingomonas sp. YR710]|uniref:TspO/MBR family protein n=1 Tax=Sphingomonas sp. YR710 TaxID=1882773 RepID=UPI000888F222|nr:TspO/MBR family protein [Sphingomonas sp. YR710]SDD54407.1 TspO and MBR related proteins [Sphingomonas sp. YR710]
MGGIASAAQLRVSYLRWALVTVPGIVLLGTLSGVVANSGNGNSWFAALAKPGFMPPGWAFGVAWTILYILMGLALAVILNARGARGRVAAITAFLLQLLLNLCWSPLFFALHRVMPAFGLILAIFVLAVITAVLFFRIRRMAGILLLPYLGWLVFAALLNWQIHALNPDAGVVPQGGDTQISL